MRHPATLRKSLENTPQIIFILKNIELFSKFLKQIQKKRLENKFFVIFCEKLCPSQKSGNCRKYLEGCRKYLEGCRKNLKGRRKYLKGCRKYLKGRRKYM